MQPRTRMGDVTSMGWQVRNLLLKLKWILTRMRAKKNQILTHRHAQITDTWHLLSLFMLTANETSKLCIIVPLRGEFTGGSPFQRFSNAESVPMAWRLHDKSQTSQSRMSQVFIQMLQHSFVFLFSHCCYQLLSIGFLSFCGWRSDFNWNKYNFFSHVTEIMVHLGPVFKPSSKMRVS